MTRYNSYTLGQIDAVMKKHPALKRLSEAERTNLYSLAQELLWNNKTKLSMTNDITIIDNIFQDDSDRATLYTITSDNLNELRTSLFNLEYFTKLAAKNKYLKLLNLDQKIFVFNLAQQSISDYRNRYDANEHLTSTISFDRYAPILKDRSVYFDVYAELRTYLLKSFVQSRSVYFDSFATLSIKKINELIRSTYFDCYATLTIGGVKCTERSIYFDCYSTLLVSGGIRSGISKSIYFDVYATLLVSGGMKPEVSRSVYFDCYPTLIVGSSVKLEITKSIYFDAYAILTVSGGLKETMSRQIFFDAFATVIAKALTINSQSVYFDSYPTLTTTGP